MRAIQFLHCRFCRADSPAAKFQYTFFDAFGHSEPPEMPITPFPTLFTAPIMREDLKDGNPEHRLSLTVANFFFQHPQTREQTPLNVYLGNIGPLQHEVYPLGSPGPMTSVEPFGSHSISREEPMGNALSGPHYLGAPPIHTQVNVTLPSIPEILQALQDDLEPSARDGAVRQNGSGSSSGVNLTALSGRSLPLLFIRAVDGVGYHSGRAIAVESLLPMLESIAPSPEGAMYLPPADLATGWQLRVI